MVESCEIEAKKVTHFYFKICFHVHISLVAAVTLENPAQFGKLFKLLRMCTTYKPILFEIKLGFKSTHLVHAHVWLSHCTSSLTVSQQYTYLIVFYLLRATKGCVHWHNLYSQCLYSWDPIKLIVPTTRSEQYQNNPMNTLHVTCTVTFGNKDKGVVKCMYRFFVLPPRHWGIWYSSYNRDKYVFYEANIFIIVLSFGYSQNNFSCVDL